MEKIPVIAIVGPTASGKTKMALAAAEKFGGEIVSADSMQIYKELSVGTAKPTKEETERVSYHLVDFLSVDKSYSVAEYIADAKKVIAEIAARGKIPVVCGGTGLYADSLLQGIEFGDAAGSEEIRKELKELSKTEGGKEKLYAELKEIDPEAAENIHPNNIGRVIRALEVYKATGIQISEHQRLSKAGEPPYKVCWVGLAFRERNKLYAQIENRVDMMLKGGLVNEAKFLFEHGENNTAAQAIGYKEFYPYFRGECSFFEAVETLKKETRHYAKRQLTWFRRNESINWVCLDDYGDSDEAFAEIQRIVENSGILPEEK